MKNTAQKTLKFKTDSIVVEFTVSPLLNTDVSKKLWKEFNKRKWTSKGIKIHEVLELSKGTNFIFYFKTSMNLTMNLTKIQSFINIYYKENS